MISAGPFHKVILQLPVLLLLSISDTPHHRRVIRECLLVAWLHENLRYTDWTSCGAPMLLTTTEGCSLAKQTEACLSDSQQPMIRKTHWHPSWAASHSTERVERYWRHWRNKNTVPPLPLPTRWEWGVGRWQHHPHPYQAGRQSDEGHKSPVAQGGPEAVSLKPSCHVT